jgi:hypothetical protein
MKKDRTPTLKEVTDLLRSINRERPDEAMPNLEYTIIKGWVDNHPCKEPRENPRITRNTNRKTGRLKK